MSEFQLPYKAISHAEFETVKEKLNQVVHSIGQPLNANDGGLLATIMVAGFKGAIAYYGLEEVSVSCLMSEESLGFLTTDLFSALSLQRVMAGYASTKAGVSSHSIIERLLSMAEGGAVSRQHGWPKAVTVQTEHWPTRQGQRQR
ncbi:hypothetical protein ZIOFF_011350 [Zingiber officinale]|uniref:Uncharacterized protein n=1 Tax=Zingiber officinale TaxID=94328 RepID=A0A8J5HQA3_ZINOF|nr:hypothetical protein ZIOFF_011350 [Zingiber officinale]